MNKNNEDVIKDFDIFYEMFESAFEIGDDAIVEKLVEYPIYKTHTKDIFYRGITRDSFNIVKYILNNHSDMFSDEHILSLKTSSIEMKIFLERFIKAKNIKFGK